MPGLGYIVLQHRVWDTLFYSTTGTTAEELNSSRKELRESSKVTPVLARRGFCVHPGFRVDRRGVRGCQEARWSHQGVSQAKMRSEVNLGYYPSRMIHFFFSFEVSEA